MAVVAVVVDIMRIGDVALVSEVEEPTTSTILDETMVDDDIIMNRDRLGETYGTVSPVVVFIVKELLLISPTMAR